MCMDYDFSGCRIQRGFITPVDWSISIDMAGVGKKTKSKEQIEHLASITYQKIYFWLDTNLPNIVFTDATDETDLYISNLCSNIMMYCPGNPSDDLIARLLHSKISVLADPDIVIGEIRIKGSDTSLRYNYTADELGYELPETTEEYFSHAKCKNEIPWWRRNDGFCFEFIEVAEGEKDPYEDIVDPLTEFHKIIENSAEDISAIREPAKILQVEKWKPKKV